MQMRNALSYVGNIDDEFYIFILSMKIKSLKNHHVSGKMIDN